MVWWWDNIYQVGRRRPIKPIEGFIEYIGDKFWEHNALEFNKKKNDSLFQNLCAAKPCLNNGTCYMGYTEKQFVCFCLTGYSGETCEKGKRFVDAKYVHRTLCTRRTKFIKSRNPATEKKKSCAYLIIILISYTLDRHPHREEGQGYKIDIKKKLETVISRKRSR